MALGTIRSATVRDWLGLLDEQGLSENYKLVLLTVVSSVLDSAAEDKIIRDNPCKAKTIRRPTGGSPTVTVWPEDRVHAVRAGLLDRFSLIVPLGCGLGLRQGEILGLSVDDLDSVAMVVRVHRQLRTVDGTLVFAPPKGGKSRTVPASPGIITEIREHEAQFPAVSITLPWREPRGEQVTARLLITGDNGRLFSGDLFTKIIWQKASGEQESVTESVLTACTPYGTSTHQYCSLRACRSRNSRTISVTRIRDSRCAPTPTSSRPATNEPGWLSTASSDGLAHLTAWRRPDHELHAVPSAWQDR
jgi:hypothetical protein